MTQKLTGAALLAEIEQNPRMPATELAVRCGYTKTTRRSGQEYTKPQLEAYYQAILMAKGDSFGIVAPEKTTSSRSDTISYKILKNGAGVVGGRFMRELDCEEGDFFFIEVGEDGTTLVLRKDVERSEQARLEAANNPETVGENEEGEDDEEEEEGSEEEVVAVQQPAIPGVSSTTVRIAQPVS